MRRLPPQDRKSDGIDRHPLPPMSSATLSTAGKPTRPDALRQRIGNQGIQRFVDDVEFRDKGKDKTKTKPQPPPAKTEAPPATPAPCVPKLKSMKVTITDKPGVKEMDGGCRLMLGTQGKANGATFTSKVEIPEGCTGTLQYVQLVDFCRTFHLTDGKDLRKKTGGFWIDTHDPVDELKVTSAGTVDFDSNDSPSQGLAGAIDTARLKDSFKLWVMWQPDQPAGAPRVPLAMTTWSWSATAKGTGAAAADCAKRFKLTSSASAGGTGKATKTSPAATSTVGPGAPPSEDGKC
jgi:hypothetical protein